MSLVERFFILCPFLGGSTIRGFTIFYLGEEVTINLRTVLGNFYLFDLVTLVLLLVSNTTLFTLYSNNSIEISVKVLHFLW